MKLQRLIPAAVLAVTTFCAASYGQHYQATDLVSNSSGKISDPNLINPWGLSRGSGSPWWVSDAGTGKSTLYQGDGTVVGLVVTIPAVKAGATGSPTGTIFNGNPKAFLLGPGFPAAFLFSTIDGTISAWNGSFDVPAKQTSKVAHIVAKGKKGSVYLGLTSATVDGKPYLYAANTGLGTIDVFNSEFKPVTFAVDAEQGAPFTDDLLPNGYMPYNVQAIGDSIVVTYTSFAGVPGDGYVDIYSPSGYLKMHLDHGAWLNGPWGIALAPTDFGTFSHALLIGNFADDGSNAADYDGTIAAYDLASGKYLGELDDAKGNWISIPGLWALSPGNVSPANLDAAASPAAAMYFTAGPGHEKNGVFGYLTATASDLVQGNDQ